MYKDIISEKIRQINKNGQLNISVEEHNSRPPTQASSEFLINKEQGDWAEKTILNAINKYSKNYVAVMYGLSNNSVAGERDFNEFFIRYQDELNSIGKRPDILILKKEDYNPAWDFNISTLDTDILDDLVPRAVSGLEIRSSSFLIGKYEEFMDNKVNIAKSEIFRAKKEISEKYGDLLKKKKASLYQIIFDVMNDNNLEDISFTRPSWHSTPDLDELSYLIRKIKDSLDDIQKRKFLSITPKMEDLALVEKWIMKYNVPHYYIQVFFDKAFGISFENILDLLLKPDEEGRIYSIEKDVKNQYKTTVKINTKLTNPVAVEIELPKHSSVMRELDRGRLLYYVRFEHSLAYLDNTSLADLLGYNLIE